MEELRIDRFNVTYMFEIINLLIMRHLPCNMLQKLFLFQLIFHILNAQKSPPVGTKSIRSKEVIIITGNFSLNGKLTNIAEYDLQTSE